MSPFAAGKELFTGPEQSGPFLLPTTGCRSERPLTQGSFCSCPAAALPDRSDKREASSLPERTGHLKRGLKAEGKQTSPSRRKKGKWDDPPRPSLQTTLPTAPPHPVRYSIGHGGRDRSWGEGEVGSDLACHE